MGAEADITIRDIRSEDAGAEPLAQADEPSGMDAAARAELDALRIRAYGRDADIAGDAAAVARLEELELLAHGGSATFRRAQPAPTATAATAALAAAASGEAAQADDRPPADTDADVDGSGESPRRRSIRPLLVAATVVVALLLGTTALASALQSVPEPATSAASESAASGAVAYGLSRSALVLDKIALDAQFGGYATPPDGPVPSFPVPGRVRWSDYLGTYYGGRLWLGGVDAGQELLCIVAVHGGIPRGGCVPREQWLQGALLLSVPAVSIAPADRPEGMESNESLGFWWAPDDAVYAVRGAAPLLHGAEVRSADAPASAAPARFKTPTDALILLRVPVDGSFGSYGNLPSTEVPKVPALWDVKWAQPLGEYYGFDLWLAGADVDGGERLCVVLAGADRGYVRSGCGDRDGWDRGGVFVSVPYAQVQPGERPNGLASGERLGFWWTPQDAVWVLAGGSRPSGAVG